GLGDPGEHRRRRPRPGQGAVVGVREPAAHRRPDRGSQGVPRSR
ncbi:MAG: hypothetical protein AVDCRST_MAG10-635, partial [uncultured Acidimicrobiales bacterium]